MTRSPPTVHPPTKVELTDAQKPCVLISHAQCNTHLHAGRRRTLALYRTVPVSLTARTRMDVKCQRSHIYTSQVFRISSGAVPRFANVNWINDIAEKLYGLWR